MQQKCVSSHDQLFKSTRSGSRAEDPHLDPATGGNSGFSLRNDFRVNLSSARITHDNHPRSLRFPRIFLCLAVPRQPLKLLETLDV